MSGLERGKIIVLEDGEALAHEAARRFTALALGACAERGRFCVALSGGSTPRRLHALLASPPWREEVPWERVFVFFGDERFLPPDDPESNYAMARETLLSRVPIPPDQVFAFPTVGVTPEDAAREYAETLAEFFAPTAPALDLVLLGIGGDGHTASLFPEKPQVTTPSEALVEAVYDAPKAPPTRLTLTYRAINGARAVIFLVSGRGKAETLRAVLQKPTHPGQLPAQGVHPHDGALLWLVDEAAAGLLNR